MSWHLNGVIVGLPDGGQCPRSSQNVALEDGENQLALPEIKP